MNDEFSNQQMINLESGENPSIKVKIRTLDNEFMVNISLENKVEELKKSIENISNVPINRQRLIFRGRLLKDNDAIRDYKITDLDVVHLVAKTGEQAENSQAEESAMNSESNTGSRRSDSIFNFMNRIVRTGDSETIEGGQTLNVPRIFPGILARRARRNNTQDNRNSDFNSIECKESIFQNMSTMRNMSESAGEATPLTKTNHNNLSNNITQTNQINNIQQESNSVSGLQLFDFKGRKLLKGQWVDVKDTIEQWLEAQVIDVKENKVYIHYNGWGTRWDEWIEMDSDRIRPFRFHTRQSTYSNYLSPFPSVKPDANVSLESNLPPQDSFFDMFDQIDQNYSITKNLMDQIRTSRNQNNISSQKEVYLAAKNLVPFLDRLGRTMSDVGAFINHSMRSNKLEDLDKKLFESTNLENELKPYDSSEILQVENEENLKRSTRESGMNVLYPVNRYDRTIQNQIPLLDSSLQIHHQRAVNTTPLVDIYVHTYVSPRERSQTNQTNTNLINNTSGSTSVTHPYLTTNAENISRGNSDSIIGNGNIINENAPNRSTFTPIQISTLGEVDNLSFRNSMNMTSERELFPDIAANSQNTDSNKSLSCADEESEGLLGNKRKPDDDLNINEPSSNRLPTERENNNIESTTQSNRGRINQGSFYDIIVEEFYENEDEAGQESLEDEEEEI